MDIEKIKHKNILYASCQPYMFKLAEKLQSNKGWIPVYWLTNSRLEKKIQSTFPNVFCHNYIDAVKGIRPKSAKNVKSIDLSLKQIQALEHIEHIVITMLNRNDSNSNSFSYNERIEFYYRQVSYWIATLTQFKVDVVIFEEEPHQASDYILYCVSNMLGVKTIMMMRTKATMGLLPMERFEEGSKPLQDEYIKLIKNYSTSNKLVLPQHVQDYFDILEGSYDTVVKEHLWNQLDRLKKVNKKSSSLSAFTPYVYFLKNGLDLKKLVARIQLVTGDSFLSDQKVSGKYMDQSKQTYIRSLFYKLITLRRKQKNKAYYDKVSSDNLDLNSNYILCALQYQPEKSTCPNGGRFVNQYLMVQMLANSLPPGWKLYIKEHPSQFVPDFTRYGEQYRNKHYYDSLLQYENTELVPLDLDMFELIDNSKGVACVGGTICWEAIVRGKQALSFGHSWMNDCEGVNSIESDADFEAALEIIVNEEIPDLDKIKLYANAIDNLGLYGAVGGPKQLDHYDISVEENAECYYRGIELLESSKV